MKLGLVVPGGFDPGGREGTIPALVSLARELGRRHQVHVFAAAGRSGAGRYQLDGVDVTQADPRAPGASWAGAGLVRAGAALGSWARSLGRLDLLHAFWADRTALLATQLARARGIPSVVSLGGGEAVWIPEIGYGGAGRAAGRLVTGAALRLAGAVTAGTSFVTRALPRRLASRAEIVPLGVDIDRFAASTARAPGPPWRLLHVADLNPVKDQTTLLLALRRVADALGDVRLDCAGVDTMNGEIQRRARALGLADRVAFLGYRPPDDLAPLYGRAHLHVLASRHESQGVAILEAAAAGLPTVGTRVGLLDTLDPDAARAVPTGDPAALGDGIQALLVDAPAREAMGAAAQRFARAHDVAWTARTFQAIYARLLAGPPVSRSAGTCAGPGRTS